ncbi:MAG: hypothetical protein II221_00050 [Paludibacteraceae bacterium]|nr:hypothetical protein [Paludibacteraceae bacterium]
MEEQQNLFLHHQRLSVSEKMLKRLFSNAVAFDYENLGDLEKMSARLKINERPFENK